jgi:hypothetical protein
LDPKNNTNKVVDLGQTGGVAPVTPTEPVVPEVPVGGGLGNPSVGQPMTSSTPTVASDEPVLTPEPTEEVVTPTGLQSEVGVESPEPVVGNVTETPTQEEPTTGAEDVGGASKI